MKEKVFLEFLAPLSNHSDLSGASSVSVFFFMVVMSM